MLVNAFVRGSLLKKFVNEVEEIMDTIANNNQSWGDAETPKVKIAVTTEVQESPTLTDMNQQLTTI